MNRAEIHARESLPRRGRADRLRAWSRSYAAFTNQEEPYMYGSRPGDGTIRYVFQDKTCLGITEAEKHMKDLMAQAGMRPLEEEK